MEIICNCHLKKSGYRNIENEDKTHYKKSNHCWRVCFFHLGHLRLFENVKKLGDYLIVAVQDGDCILKTKPDANMLYTTEQQIDLVKALNELGAQMANVDLVIERLADFPHRKSFPRHRDRRGFVVMCNKIEHGIQVVLLRGLRQAVVLHVGHESLTQRCAAALQNFGTFAFLRSFRKIVSLPLVRFRLNVFSISGMRLVLSGFRRSVSTLFGFLTAVSYGMGVVIIHVRCLSRSVLDTSLVNKVKMLIPVAAWIASYYIINPGIVKTRARRFSLISIAVGRLQSVPTLRQVCGFRTGSYSTFETLKVFAA